MTAREQEIAGYVDQVRRALADLPPAVRDELLEELPEHLTEVAAETDGPLTDRLGPPGAYAAELRAAAGLTAVPKRFTLNGRLAARLGGARRRLRTVDTRLGPLIGYERASEFLRLLRPAWWLLRAYLAALFLSLLTGDGPLGLLPRLGDNELAGVLMLAGLLIGSIWLGKRGDRLPRWPRLAVRLGGGLAVLFGLVALFQLDGQARQHPSYEYTPTFGDQYSQVQDVYVYDQQGRLLEGVRLFDQNGVPIRLGYPWCPDPVQTYGDGERWPYRSGEAEGVWPTYPYCPQHAPFRVTGPGPATPPAPATPAPPVGSAPVTPSAEPSD